MFVFHRGGISAVEPIELSETDYKRLRLQARRAIGRVSERIHYVLLFARSYPLGQIAHLYQVDERTVATWIERFRESGVEGLDDHPRSGRPRKLSMAARLEAQRCLETTPEDVGLERTTWTRRLLRWHLRERIGCALSASSVVRVIAALGFVWRRPKLTLKESDPQAQTRQEAIEQAIAAH